MSSEPGFLAWVPEHTVVERFDDGECRADGNVVPVEPDYEAHRLEIEALVHHVLYAMKYGNQEERARAGEVSIEAASEIAAALGIGGDDE